MKVVINACYGGYSLSEKALIWLYYKGYDGEGFKWIPSQYSNDWETLLEQWKNRDRKRVFYGSIFSPDDKFVLNARPKSRTDKLIVECVEALGREANGACAHLKVVEIPDGIVWEIDEYDGFETIHEQHRTWG